MQAKIQVLALFSVGKFKNNKNMKHTDVRAQNPTQSWLL